MDTQILRRPFGTAQQGEAVERFQMESPQLQVHLIGYGAAIQSIRVPDGQGGFVDVALGYDTLKEYEEGDGYLGALIGRVSNRIAAGRFTLGETEHHLDRNEGDDHLHGGYRGFDKFVWQASLCRDGVCFSRLSPDGEGGYPGDLAVQVTYRLRGARLTVETRARSSRDTLCSLTGHTYFNLNGGGDVLGHGLTLRAETFLPHEAGRIPESAAVPAAGTAFDFRREKTVGADMAAVPGGYDHHFCLGPPGPLREAAVLRGERSGIVMTVSTTLPGMQVYTANGLSRRRGKGGQRYGPHSGICLETQYAPNAFRCPGQQPPILPAGALYCHRTELFFRREGDGT